ncbi:MAG: hypothetical protein IJ836_04835 [Spirochaetales bacterium]|nr:hypothetical protein [Spirochaetales bacterium]
MRYLLLLIFLFSSMSLPAAIFRSNIVGQKLEELSAIPPSGWYLEEEEGVERLFEDGEIVSERRFTDDSESITTSAGTRTITYKGGRRDSEKKEDGTLVRYIYSEEGFLKRAIISRDGEAEEVLEYSYSAASGLSSVKSTSLSRSYYSRSSLTYVDDGDSVRVSFLPGGQFIREVYKGEGKVEDSLSETKVEENGNITVKENLGSYILSTTYSPTGLVLSEETFDGEISVSKLEYIYSEDETLVSSVRNEGDTETIRYYSESGVLTKEDKFTSGLIDVSRSYQSDGRIIETIYKGGRAYSEVLLDKDGLRVLDLKMLR